MPRPSVIPEIREKLEIWLNGMEDQYQSQPEESRTPTLPYTPDRKINVRGVAEAIGLKKTQEKYFYERDELTSLVDLFAEGQGLLPIGARMKDFGDEALKQRIIMTAKSAKADAQAATEAKAREEALIEELYKAKKENALLVEENVRLKAQLDMIYTGYIVRVT